MDRYTFEGQPLPQPAAVTIQLATWLRTADLSLAALAGADLAGQNLAGVPAGGSDLGGAKLAAARMDGQDPRMDPPTPPPRTWPAQRLQAAPCGSSGGADGQPLSVSGTLVTGRYAWDAASQRQGRPPTGSRRRGCALGMTHLPLERLRESGAQGGQLSRSGDAYAALPAGTHSFAVLGASQMLTESGERLTGASVSHDLSEHSLRGAALAGVTLQSTRLDGAVLDATTVWGSGEVGGVAAAGVRLPQGLPTGRVTHHLQHGTWRFWDAEATRCSPRSPAAPWSTASRTCSGRAGRSQTAPSSAPCRRPARLPTSASSGSRPLTAPRPWWTRRDSRLDGSALAGLGAVNGTALKGCVAARRGVRP